MILILELVIFKSFRQTLFFNLIKCTFLKTKYLKIPFTSIQLFFLNHERSKWNKDWFIFNWDHAFLSFIGETTCLKNPLAFSTKSTEIKSVAICPKFFCNILLNFKDIFLFVFSYPIFAPDYLRCYNTFLNPPPDN